MGVRDGYSARSEHAMWIYDMIWMCYGYGLEYTIPMCDMDVTGCVM